MKKLLLGLLLVVATSANANGSEFCDGFEEGFKIVKGDMALVPLCPLEPLTPLGSTPYREGIKAGMRVGRRGY
mgnify:CR=1 FL=1|jgi:hypothetical protein